MKKLLFIDHAFHQKTRSADFFTDIVRQGFEVEVYYLTPDEPADIGVLVAAEAADVVLLWQIDFLAPVFLAMGKPTIVIPMFDGSDCLPDLHWAFANGARFFNFSLRLNERIRLLSGQTKLLRYFPAPVAEASLPRFDRLNAFFWQRRPDHGVNFNYVARLIGQELDSFHLHNVPDVPGHYRADASIETPFKFTESSWFEKKSDYETCLASSNVFIAPRASEGIGLALLEAMARGMLVLAHDAPTNNEYISNGINGILYNKDVRHDPIPLRGQAQQLGRAAWRTVVEGHQQWMASHPEILDWIEGAPAPRPIDMDLELFFRDAWNSFYGSLDSYDSFLRRHLSLLERLSPLPNARVLELIGGKPLPRGAAYVDPGSRLDGIGLLDLTLENDRYIGPGWSAAEPEWRWAIGKSSELHFSGLESGSERVRARFIASALPELGKSVRCTIAFNGTPVFADRVTPDWSEYEFTIKPELLRSVNKMELTFDKAMTLPTDTRELSVCFKSFRFDTDASSPSSEPGLLARGSRLLKSIVRERDLAAPPHQN